MIQLFTSTGFGSSGSSAVTDILREYACIDTKSSEFECTFLHEPDGLADLDDAIREGHRLKVDLAATRFLERAKALSRQSDYRTLFGGKFYEISSDFIESLFPIKWHGWWHGRDDEKKAFPFIKRRHIACAKGFYDSRRGEFCLYETYGWHPSYRHYSEMRYGNDTGHFFSCAKLYTERLIEAIGSEKNMLCVDQLLPAMSIRKYLSYFETEPKVFVVDRDPRDIYIANQIFTADRYMPTADINVFIEWYRATRKKSCEDWQLENVCPLKLDDLCNDYDNQIAKIESFLGLPESSHTRPFACFIPEKSKTNTQLYRRYTNYSAEVARIEKELKEFLYTGCVIPCGNPQRHGNPLIEIVSQCDEIQDGKRFYKGKLIAVFFSTYFCKQIRIFPSRKTFVSKCIGIIRLWAGIVLFVPEFLLNIIL